MTEGGERIVEIFTDGACLGNPGPGGWGAILRYGAHEKELYGSDPSTTNNRMELMAAIRALESLKRPSSVQLSSDSKYVVLGAKNSLVKWRANGWLTSNKTAVKNIDLWERLDASMQGHTIEWRWVRGHDGHVENERADRLAVRGAKEAAEHAKAEPTTPPPLFPYHPSDLFSVREEPPIRNAPARIASPASDRPSARDESKPAPATSSDGDLCRHELPPGQCDYCRALPPGVLAHGYRTRGGLAYHNDPRCKWLLDGQRQSFRQGKNVHEIVPVAWHAVGPAELQPCEGCCTPQWIRRHQR